MCANSTFCLICQSGYSANNSGICLPCISSCRVCSGVAQGTCFECGLGFYLNSQSTCSVCSSNCTSCSSSSVCLTCATGYYLTRSSTCVAQCQSNCASCSSNSPTFCQSCLVGYSLNSASGNCVAVTNCSTSNPCIACPSQYTLFNNTCIKCASGCNRCLPNSPNICTVCSSGYTLNYNNNTCMACSSNCATCSYSSNCLTCSSGYVIAVSTVSISGQCVPCASPCSTCY